MAGTALVVPIALALVVLSGILLCALARLRRVILASRDPVAALDARGKDVGGVHGDNRVHEHQGAGGDGRAAPRVSAVVITLNEERQIEQCLEHLLAARPAFEEVIVCDGGSTDETVRIATRVAAAQEQEQELMSTGRVVGRAHESSGGRRRAGQSRQRRGARQQSAHRTRTRVFVSETKGRAAQLNAGARMAAHAADALVFVHADSRPPQTCVQDVRTALFKHDDAGDATDVGLFGFPTRIAMFDESGHYAPSSETRILWLTTIHEYISYAFYPLLFQPLSFLRGLRCLFGDQNLSIRTADVFELGGYDDALRIMEDLDLCLRVVDKLGKRVERSAHWGASSGRRIAHWGELRATYIHFRISVVWYAGRVVENVIGGRWPWIRRLMRREYEHVYTDEAR